MSVHVTVWNEYRAEKELDEAREQYPDGIHNAIAGFLEDAGYDTGTATLDEPDHGLSEDVLEETDVLVWWDHFARDEVEDEVAERVREHVRDGMGLIVLHGSGGKVFSGLMGTSCSLKWREAEEKERLWVVQPGHPITEGVDEYVEIPTAEMYGEYHDIPEPDTLVFISWFEGGEVFRSGCCYHRGEGKIFYFRPGHETYPIFHQDEIQQIIANGVDWAAPTTTNGIISGNHEALEPLD